MTRTRKKQAESPEEQPLPDPNKKKEHLERSKRQMKTLQGLLEKEKEIMGNQQHIAEKTRKRIKKMLQSLPLYPDDQE